MQVVAAGVHHRDLGAGVVGGGRGARVRQARGLLHRQGVHVGAEHDHGALAVAQDGDHAGAAHAGGDLPVALRREPLRDQGRRALLLEGELGVGVQVLVVGLQGGEQRFQRVEHCGQGVHGVLTRRRGCREGVLAHAPGGEQRRRAGDRRPPRHPAAVAGGAQPLGEGREGAAEEADREGGGQADGDRPDGGREELPAKTLLTARGRASRKSSTTVTTGTGTRPATMPASRGTEPSASPAKPVRRTGRAPNRSAAFRRRACRRGGPPCRGAGPRRPPPWWRRPRRRRTPGSRP